MPYSNDTEISNHDGGRSTGLAVRITDIITTNKPLPQVHLTSAFPSPVLLPANITMSYTSVNRWNLSLVSKSNWQRIIQISLLVPTPILFLPLPDDHRWLVSLILIFRWREGSLSSLPSSPTPGRCWTRKMAKGTTDSRVEFFGFPNSWSTIQTSSLLGLVW